MIQSNPTREDYKDFRNKVYKLRDVLPLINNPSGLLILASKGDQENYIRIFRDLFNFCPENPVNILYDKQSAELLKQHKIYTWLNNDNDFMQAYKSFQRKKAFKENLKKNAAYLFQLEFMAICLTHIMEYLYKKNNKIRPNSMTKPKRESALKTAKKLEQCLSSGITLMDQSDNDKLRLLVYELVYELEHHVPTLSPSANSGYLLEREFVHNISLTFLKFYNEHCASVTRHLLNVISDSYISKDTIDNWIKEVKIYIKNRDAYFRSGALRK